MILLKTKSASLNILQKTEGQRTLSLSFDRFYYKFQLLSTKKNHEIWLELEHKLNKTISKAIYTHISYSHSS